MGLENAVHARIFLIDEVLSLLCTVVESGALTTWRATRRDICEICGDRFAERIKIMHPVSYTIGSVETAFLTAAVTVFARGSLLLWYLSEARMLMRHDLSPRGAAKALLLISAALKHSCPLVALVAVRAVKRGLQDLVVLRCQENISRGDREMFFQIADSRVLMREIMKAFDGYYLDHVIISQLLMAYKQLTRDPISRFTWKR